MAAILEAGPQDLMAVRGIGKEMAALIMDRRGALDPVAEERRAEEYGARIVTQLDADYPEPLRAIYDPPLALYVQGTLVPRDRHALALIGSRRTSHYGRQVADRLAFQLAKTGYTVVSGLARGIDTAAHEGALKGGGRTLAVLGGALDHFYPPENRELAERISGQGAVLSEFPFGRAPDRTTFPMRNRICSGLTMGVVVVEAGFKSGALHTADAALEQGRTVFAVPGRVDAPTSRGAHQLIKNGARLVEDADDILKEFEFLVPLEKRQAAPHLEARPEVQLTDEEQAIVKALWAGERNVDELARDAGLASARVSSLLIGLEMKRVVRVLPGRVVELSVPGEPAGKC